MLLLLYRFVKKKNHLFFTGINLLTLLMPTGLIFLVIVKLKYFNINRPNVAQAVLLTRCNLTFELPRPNCFGLRWPAFLQKT